MTENLIYLVPRRDLTGFLEGEGKEIYTTTCTPTWKPRDSQKSDLIHSQEPNGEKTRKKVSVLDVGGKPQRVIPGENPHSPVGTENLNLIVPPPPPWWNRYLNWSVDILFWTYRSGNLSSLAAKLSSTTISSPTKTRSTPGTYFTLQEIGRREDITWRTNWPNSPDDDDDHNNLLRSILFIDHSLI